MIDFDGILTFVPFPIESVLSILEQEVASYSVPLLDLVAVQAREPYRVLVATILSARTRDEITARAAARLFAQAPDLTGLAALPVEVIAELIQPVGFHKRKAEHLARLPGVLASSFGGRIPDTVEELLELPGVGRKTANLVVAVAFGKPAICVDTHVHRIMNIWGYVKTRSPLETEMALRAKLPERHWLKVNFILVAFGQGTCRPMAPHCDECVINAQCPRLGVIPRKIPRKGVFSMSSTGISRRFISWNVNGLRAIAQKGFTGFLVNEAPEALLIQEIKASPEQLPAELKEIPGYTAFWFPAEKKGYAGVATYTKQEPKRVIHGMEHVDHDREGRVLTLEYEDLYLVNAYFPNAQPELVRLGYKLAFDRDLLVFVEKLAQEKTVLIGGDFNVAHKPIDLARPKGNEKNPGFSPEERAWMDEFVAAGFVDTFRIFNQEAGQYTWWSYRAGARAKNIGWRIDYFCVDGKSRERVKNAGILPEVMGSDHCPVWVEL